VLNDDARCRILCAHPVLTADAGEALCGAFDKLFTQFARENRLERWSCTVEHDGAALVLAWEPGAPLSGCSHDRISRLLAHHEEATGRQLLAPPPFCVQLDGAWRCLDRAGLRAQATAAAPLLDARLERLGDWRTRGLTTVGASWAAAVLAKAAIPS
jgi:hypothetical protein